MHSTHAWMHKQLQNDLTKTCCAKLMLQFVLHFGLLGGCKRSWRHTANNCFLFPDLLLKLFKLIWALTCTGQQSTNCMLNPNIVAERLQNSLFFETCHPTYEGLIKPYLVFLECPSKNVTGLKSKHGTKLELQKTNYIHALHNFAQLTLIWVLRCLKIHSIATESAVYIWVLAATGALFYLL